MENDPRTRPPSSAARRRIKRHLAALVTMTATTTLTTIACACDMLPPPAHPHLELYNIEVEATFEPDGATISATLKPLAGQPSAVFEEAVAELKGAVLVSSSGGPSLSLRVRVAPGSTDVTATVTYRSGYASDAPRPMRLELTPGAQPKPGDAVKAWLTDLPPQPR